MLTPHEQQNFKKYADGLDVSRMTKVFDALGEPKRCKIFRSLVAHDGVSVGELASALDISQSLTSQNLKILRDVGIVTRVSDGKYAYYRVEHDDPLVRAIKNALEA